MIDPALFENVHLSGGFVITTVELTNEPLTDALGRPALAKTGIVGMRFDLLIYGGLDERKLSVTLYHEILEAALIASPEPPLAVIEFYEADFERIAYAMHEDLGPASPASLNRMLQLLGFGEG